MIRTSMVMQMDLQKMLTTILPNINSNAEEPCDDIDNNCDGQIDEVKQLFYADGDGDGYGETSYSVESEAPEEGVDNDLDCDDQMMRCTQMLQSSVMSWTTATK